MDQLALHIEYLLQRHDCVILPGTGAVMAVTEPAYFDEERCLFVPPMRRICFNAAIVNDDGVLANSYSRRMGVSFDEGRRILARELEALNSSLLLNKEVSLGKTGMLTLTEAGTIEFHPHLTPEQMMSEMGMPAIPMKPAPVATEDSNVGAPAVAAAAAEVKETPAEDSTLSSEKETDNAKPRFNPDCYYVAVNKRFAHMAASVLLVLIVTLTFIIPGDKNQRLPQTASVIPLTTATAGNAEEKEERSEERVEAPAPEQLTQEAEPSHYLIVATFRNAEEAERYIMDNAGGDDSLELLEGETVCRVAVASSANVGPLHTMLNDPEFHSRHPQAWIWTRK